MKTFWLSIKNLTRRPGRTVALVLLTALLALAVFGGSAVVLSLRSGLDSLEARLGADIIVLPIEAESKKSLENLLLQGTVGAFYMDASALERVRAVEGVEAAAPQTFLATLKADCCAIRVQVIGIDPESDFTVQPWIAESYSRALGDMDVAVGCNVTAGVGETLRIYDVGCNVVARLDETGTGLDTAVYCNMDTMRKLLAAAEAKGVSHKISADGAQKISAIYVKVRSGADIDAVKSRIVRAVKRADATAKRTRTMITGVSDSLSGVSRTVTLLIAAVWVLCLAILLVAFALIIRERKREFAVVRLLGASRGMVAGMVLRESALCGLAGGLAGTGLAALLIFPFSAYIESRMKLPYLTPSTPTLLGLALGTVLLTALAAALASAWAARRLSRVDPGNALREGS